MYDYARLYLKNKVILLMKKGIIASVILGFSNALQKA